MEQQLKERLVGATVLVVIAIIVIPIVLDGPDRGGKVEQELELPAARSGERQTVRIPLDAPGESGQGEPAAANDPVVSEPETRPETAVAHSGPDASSAAEESGPPVGEPESRADAVPPKDEPAPVTANEPASDSESIPDAPWTVQAGSFSSEENAAGLVARLRELGYAEAYISRYNDGSRIHYRVRIGGFPDRDAAAAKAEEISDRSGEPARPAQNTGG